MADDDVMQVTGPARITPELIEAILLARMDERVEAVMNVVAYSAERPHVRPDDRSPT